MFKIPLYLLTGLCLTHVLKGPEDLTQRTQSESLRAHNHSEKSAEEKLGVAQGNVSEDTVRIVPTIT